MRKLPIFNITIFILFSFFLLFLHLTPVYSVTEEELENQIEETQQEIEENESVLENIEKMIAGFAED